MSSRLMLSITYSRHVKLAAPLLVLGVPNRNFHYATNPRDPKIVAAVDRWSLFKGYLCYKRSNWDLTMVAVVDRWSLFGGGR